MLRAVIYCRVSTEEQAEKGYSLDAQEKSCKNFAQNNDYDVVEIYRDEGKSATSLKRPALQDLLSKCQNDKSINALIIQETDRLARNTIDHLSIKSLLKKCDVKLISVNQPMLDDSPEGNMVDTMLASVNQFYSDLNGRKTIKGMMEKFSTGCWPGRAPLGYINTIAPGSENDKKAKRIISNDPQKWHLVRQAFKMYLTGDYSVMEINDILYKKGLRSITGIKVPKSIMFRILQNQFYAGVMKWNGQEKIGNHKPMITMGEHKKIQQIMEAHLLHACRRRKHSFLLRGFIVCNQCGCRYTAEKRPKKKKAYYHCTSAKNGHSNRGQLIEVNVLEKLIEEQFKRIEFNQDFIELLRNKLQDIHNEKKMVINNQKQVLNNQKKALELKRDKAEEKLFAGIISDDDFIRLRDKFRLDIKVIQDQLITLDCQKDYDIDVIFEIIKFTHNCYDVYKTAPYELKRYFLGLFWDKFLMQDRKIIKAIPTKLILALEAEKKVLIRDDWGD